MPHMHISIISMLLALEYFMPLSPFTKNTIDVLIDGKFVIEERSLDTPFRGSKNQRIIDVQDSLKNDEICIINKYDSL